MEVLLLKDVEQLGEAGEIKWVANGYARNFLIPRGLAVIATPGAIKQAELHSESEARRQAKELDEAQALAQALDGRTVTFQARAGEGTKLYGSITSHDIAEKLTETLGKEFDRRKIHLDSPLRQLGTHRVPIRLQADIIPEIVVVIEREDEPSAE